jgi:hypothetical protein
MAKLLEGLGATFLVVTCILVGSVAGRNLVHAEAHGTVPVERLAVRGSELEKSVTRAVIDSLTVGPYPPEWDWYARREVSTNGDTIRFRIYRAKDARLLGRVLRPKPIYAGGATYVVSRRRLRGPAIGVR